MSSLSSDDSSFGGPDQPQGQEEVIPCQSVLLHGSLVIQVKKARNLPDKVSFRKCVARVISLLPGTRRENIISSTYVTISLSNAVIGSTFVTGDIKNPVWDQHFDVPVAHYASQVIFDVKHSDLFGSKTIGSVGISAQRLCSLCSSEIVEQDFPIQLETTTGRCIPEAVLTLSIQYTSVEQLALSLDAQGVSSDPDHQGVPGTYFPLTKGGKVTLYQDAHVPDVCLKLDGCVEYEHGSCWQDIYHAINNAHHLIYIAGWSLDPKVRLLRNNETTLGDLLKEKARKGVKVVLLVWKDRFSFEIMGWIKDWVMHTGDQEAQLFFKDSSVQILLCRRSSVWEKKDRIYAHHQKTVIVDADAGDSKRKIIAFVGGLDLCRGRYDTPEHPLFRTLQTMHKDDYHNPTFSERFVGCPREPWHDLHCKIEGPAAYDILTNFEQRWGKTPKRGDALLKIDPEVFVMADDSRSSENGIEAWNVQVFRSIDSSSVEGFLNNPEDPRTKNLVCGKNVLIDMSIQAAYVNAIRSAQYFIYMENQYFLGSSYNWDFDDDEGDDEGENSNHDRGIWKKD